MENQPFSNEQRVQPRLAAELPAMISIGSQLTVKGQLRDISLSSAFIKIKNNIYLQINDEITITIQCASDDADAQILTKARISRIVPGEGFAIYFSKMDDNSTKLLKKLLQKSI
jgi:hypothetical protein